MMEEKKLKISVGIPAYNEENSIKRVVDSILNQMGNNFELYEIIVVSDGSNDKTAEIVSSIKVERIILLNDGERKGKSARMNEIINLFTGEALFLVDADVTIVDNNVISKVLKQTNLKQVGLVSVNTIPLKARTFVEACINYSVDLIIELRKKWNDGKNFLSFKGAFLAADRDFIKKISLPVNVVGNDAYLYLSAIRAGFAPDYIEDVKVYYRSPSTLKDHAKQSQRFVASQISLKEVFQKEMSDPDYSIPKSLMYKLSLKYLIKNPILFLGYIFINLIVKFKKQKPVSATWSMANSTKK